MTVLGSMMIDNSTIPIALDLLKEGDAFYGDSHLEIYNAIVDLYHQRTPVEPSILTAKLRDRGVFDRVGGFPFLAKLETSVIAADNIAAHAEIVLERYRKRRIIEQSHDWISDGSTTMKTADELVTEGLKFFLHLKQNRKGEGPRRLRDLFMEEFHELEALIAAGKRREGALIGIPAIDNEYGGVRRDDLIVIGADPSVGKTAFYLQSMEGVSLSEDSKGLPSLMFSMDASWQEILHRYITRETGVSLTKLARGAISEAELLRIQQRCARIIDMPIYIDDASSLRIEEIEARAMRLAAEHGGLSSFGVDYAQMLGGDDRILERLQEAAPRLKSLGKRIGCPGFILSQLNQKERKNGVPTMDSLQYGSPLKQEATRVYLLWREKAMPKEPVYLSVAKIKRGMPKIVKLLFNGEAQRFVPFDDEDDSDPFTGRPYAHQGDFTDDLPA